MCCLKDIIDIIDIMFFFQWISYDIMFFFSVVSYKLSIRWTLQTLSPAQGPELAPLDVPLTVMGDIGFDQDRG